jgi:hypothetical protein
MLRSKKIAVILFALLALGCNQEDTTGPSANDPVEAIVNASSRASHTNHWHVDIGAGTSDWAFFADGNGRYRHTTQAPQGQDFTWSKLGPDALLISISIQNTFTNLNAISGSIGSGTFTARLDGNATPRTFAVAPGQL